jgi:hypothetical protein
VNGQVLMALRLGDGPEDACVQRLNVLQHSNDVNTVQAQPASPLYAVRACDDGHKRKSFIESGLRR